MDMDVSPSYALVRLVSDKREALPLLRMAAAGAKRDHDYRDHESYGEGGDNPDTSSPVPRSIPEVPEPHILPPPPAPSPSPEWIPEPRPMIEPAEPWPRCANPPGCPRIAP